MKQIPDYIREPLENQVKTAEGCSKEDKEINIIKFYQIEGVIKDLGYNLNDVEDLNKRILGVIMN